MPIAPVLQRFVDDELDRAPALIERTLAGTLQLLRDPRDSALSGAEHAHQFAIVQALQQRDAAYRSAFLQALQASVQESLAEQAGAAAGAALSIRSGGLELMDESRVEIDIEISRAMQLIDTTAEWELRELQTFTSTLVGQTHVSAESNPFRPLVFASALWAAACAASPVQVHRTTLLRVSAGVTAGLLKNAWAAASTRLEAQGVAPGIYRTVLLAPGSVSARGPALGDGAKPGTIANLLASMPGGSDSLQVGVGSAARAMGTSAPRRALADASPEFTQALARLDELLQHLPPPTEAARDPGHALVKRLNLHRAALLASTSAPLERQIIELLSRVFDTILADPQVPPAFAAVMLRLQASALRVALRDAEMIDSTRHPVWQLLDRIAHAGAGYPQAGDVRGAELLEFCRDATTPLARHPAPDASLYRRALTQLDAFLAEQLQSQLHAAHANVSTLQLAERREVLEQRLAQRLVDQMVPVRTTPSVRRFMTGAWARVLAASMLRHGEQADETRGYIKFVDELLWSVQLPDHPRSRQRLVTLLPGMLERLHAGTESIGLPAAERQAFLDELMAIHTEALRPGGQGEASALTPEQIVQRMRDEVLPASTGHGGFTDSVIDLSSMETVPAEVMTDASASDESARRVEALREGDRLRVFLQGRWARVQLLWRSEQGLYFLFAGETAARTHSITHRALERLNSAGLLQPLEARPLVQRALDVVTRELVKS